MAKDNNLHLYKQVLQRLRASLRERDLTQARIGKALGIRQAAVSQLLNGKANLNLPQLLKICALLGISAHDLLQRTEGEAALGGEHPEFVAEVLYRSWRHVLVYVACLQERTLAQLVNDHLTAQDVGDVLRDLQKVGLIQKRQGRYRQRDIHRYLTSASLEQMQRHAELLARCLDNWSQNRRVKREAYTKTRFNYFHLDYFTDDQLGELEAMLWNVFDRVKEIQARNLASGYRNSRRMRLWDIHLSLLTPLETR